RDQRRPASEPRHRPGPFEAPARAGHIRRFRSGLAVRGSTLFGGSGGVRPPGHPPLSAGRTRACVCRAPGSFCRCTQGADGSVNGTSVIRSGLESMGLPRGDLLSCPDSHKRFPDGAQYRVEIPSTEGPDGLRAVLEEARRLEVRVHRVSQGSGVLLMTDEELDRMAEMAVEAQVEVSLFTRPNAAWGVSAMGRSTAGGRAAAVSHGQEQLVACLEDARRAAEHGFRSVLIADLGVLAAFHGLRQSGVLPSDMQAKVSVMLPV